MLRLERLEPRCLYTANLETQQHLAGFLLVRSQLAWLTGERDTSAIAKATNALFDHDTQEAVLARVISNNPAIQQHYEKCLDNGVSESLAEMFALAQPPMSNTDREFLEGWGEANQFEGATWAGNLYEAEARQAGVDTTGRRYLHALAAYPGDPKAWVSSRDDVRRVCEERGWGCRGAVNVKAREPESAPVEVPIASDLVDAKVAEILGDLPAGDAQHVDVQDLREQVTEKMTPSWSD